MVSTWQHGDITKATRVAGSPSPASTLSDALAAITCPALIMPTRTDQYFDVSDSEEEVKHLPEGKLKVVETIYGHIGGGGGGSKEDNVFINDAIRDFLA